MEFGPATIKDGLILKMKCGTSAYEYLRKKFPYPSARTLQRHSRHIEFKSGILEEVFDMLLLQIRYKKEQELDCALAMEEMAIIPSRRTDPSTKEPIGDVTLQSHSGTANKALVFVLGGISTRWKQAVAYYFTRAKAEGEASDAVGKELAGIVLDIVQRAEAIGLRVHSVTSDMGSENRAMWRHLGLYCNRYGCRFSIPHPTRQGDSLCFIPDVPHVFKSMKRMLVVNGVITLPADIVREENLPSDKVYARHLHDLINAEGKFQLKVAPRLTEESLQPKGRFAPMKVGVSRSFINRRTGTGLQLLALDKQDPPYITTAWFVNHVNRWFDLMTSRLRAVALSRSNENAYKNAISHLEKNIRVFTGMKVGEPPQWKPVQTGVIMATNSILHIQDVLLNKRLDNKFSFLLTSRFSQDFLENLFSSVRARQVYRTRLPLKTF